MSQLDASEIRELVDLYGFAVDTRRWDLFDRVFSKKNLLCDFGGAAVWTDLEQFKNDFEAFHAVLDSTHHLMCNFMYDIKGDKAVSVTYGHWIQVRHGMRDGDKWAGYGWYNDNFEKEDDGWRIVKRSVRINSWEGNSNILNPAGDVPGDSFKVSVDTVSLYSESQAGAIPLLNSIDGKE